MAAPVWWPAGIPYPQPPLMSPYYIAQGGGGTLSNLRHWQDKVAIQKAEAAYKRSQRVTEAVQVSRTMPAVPMPDIPQRTGEATEAFTPIVNVDPIRRGGTAPDVPPPATFTPAFAPTLEADETFAPVPTSLPIVTEERGGNPEGVVGDKASGLSPLLIIAALAAGAYVLSRKR